jgi:hypothetical protein
LPYSKSLPADAPREDFACRKTVDYGLGVDVVVLVLVDDSVVVPGDELVLVSGVEVAVAGDDVVVVDDELELPPPAGEGFTIVVLLSPAGEAAGVTVSLFCSQATRSAAPARMQRYFFIVCKGARVGHS